MLLYTRYPIVARAWPSGCARRASKGILHTIDATADRNIQFTLSLGIVCKIFLYARFLCSRAHSAYAAARPSARATIGYLVYNILLIARALGLKTEQLPGLGCYGLTITTIFRPREHVRSCILYTNCCFA